MEKHITCIYHKNCVDGTTAAAIVLRKFPNAQFFPLSHSYTESDMAEVLKATPQNAEVYIVDSTLGIKECIQNNNTITVIDHHISEKSAMEDVAATHDQVTFIFDNEKSGASLCWSYFFMDESLPELITLVEDSDLWNQKYGDVTKDVNNYLSIFRNDPKKVLDCIEGDIENIKKQGRIISEYTDNAVERLVTLAPISITVGAHEVPAFNITDHQSACGNILSTELDRAVALFTIAGDSVKISFRSNDHQSPSALELAKILGGGGHRNASGAAMALQEFYKAYTA